MSGSSWTARRNRGGTSASQGERPGSLDSTSSADGTVEEELLRMVAQEVEERSRARKRAEGRSSSTPSSPSRFWRGARDAAKRVLGIAKNPSPSSPRSARRTLREELASSHVAGTSRSVREELASSQVAATSRSASEETARTRSDDERRSEQQPVAFTRSEYAAVMRSALAMIQDGAAAGVEFTHMEQAMSGVMDLSYKKVELPKLPCEFATKWPHGDADPLHEGVMGDPVILASGYSVDQSYQQWFMSQKNTCPVTTHSLPHSLTVPNHLIRDMIAAWCLDHSYRPPFTTSDTLSIPSVPPSEEQIQDLLAKFSGNSGLQKEALHLIYLMSKTSKGVQPCLDKWPDLVPVLIDLKKKWNSSWTHDLEGERLALILNLSMHMPNRGILAGETKLPGVLKHVVEKADRLGTSASLLAMVASIVAVLSEFDMFRKRMLDIGGMEMLRDLLKIEDIVVRKETCTAILALCTDEEGKSSAVVSDVPDMLLECFMVMDEFLLLLDRLPKDPHVLDKICDRAVEFVNIVMEEDASGMVTSQGIESAISLIYIISLRDVGKLKMKNVEDFKEWLREMSSKRLSMQTLFHVDEISKTLSEMFPAPTRRVQN